MLNMWSMMCLNKLKSVDVGFFIACAVVILLIVAVYFLIPVFNKKLYREQRENLQKREAAFKSNLQTAQPDNAVEAAEADAKEEEADTVKAEVSKDE